MERLRTTISFDINVPPNRTRLEVEAKAAQWAGDAARWLAGEMIPDGQRKVLDFAVRSDEIPVQWPHGSIVLLRGGHAEHVAVRPERLAALVRDKRGSGEPFMELKSSATPGYVAFLDVHEIVAVKPSAGESR